MTRTFGTLEYANGEWVMDAEPHVVIRAKRVFAQVSTHAHGSIHLSDGIETARDLEWFMERYPLEASKATLTRLRRSARDHKEKETILNLLLSGKRDPRPFELAHPPRQYQRIAADLCLSTGGLLCADDLGLGKTVTGICVLSAPAARPALVVTLTHLPTQWEREIKRFCPELTTHVLAKGTPYDLRVRPDGSTPSIRKKHDEGQLSLVPEEDLVLPDVIITSYSKLAGWADTLAPILKSVVYDEVQELRRRDTAKASSAKHISDSVDVRLGLSATPVYNYGDEIFAVMEVIRPGALGTREEFIREWCQGNYGPSGAKVNDPAALGAFLREHGLMLRRTRSDVGRELPALSQVHHEVNADLSLIASAEDAASELARVILSSTSSFMDRGMASRELDMKLRQATGIAKAPYVAEFVRMLVESGEKVVLYGWHREVYSIWLSRLEDLSPVLYTGTENAKQKEESKRLFVEGEAKVLIMSLRSGAGLDGLQDHARTVVFGELDWSPGVHAQCEGRVHRDGQEDPVIAYYLTSEAGSDPIVADLLGIKSYQARGIRDPNAPEVEVLAGAEAGRGRLLAEALIERRRESA